MTPPQQQAAPALPAGAESPAPDAVYIVGPGHNNDELRFSLRSIVKNLRHGRVWLAGFKPRWITDAANHIPVRQDGSKYANSTANVVAACRTGEVSDPFILLNDDFFVMRQVEQVPTLHRGPVSAVLTRYRARYPRGNPYITGMVETAHLLAGLRITDPLSYELHVPMLIHKSPFLDAMAQAEGFGHALHKRTLYGNVARLGGAHVEDVKVSRNLDPWQTDWTFLSTNDHTFQNGRIGTHIRRQFRKQPTVYEADR